MRIAVCNDIYSFKLASGIYVWYEHFFRMLNELGIHDIDMLVPCSEERFFATPQIVAAYEPYRNGSIRFHFAPPGLTREESYGAYVNEYLAHYTPDLIVATNAEECIIARWHTRGIPIAIYQHTGRHVYKDSAIIESACSFQENVHSLVISDLAGAVLDRRGLRNSVQFQPYYAPRRAEKLGEEYMITCTGGYACKRDELAIDLCERNNIPLKGLGRYPGFDLVPNDEVYLHLQRARCMVHMSTEDMVPYAFLEAAQYCNIICDVNQMWVHGLNMYHLPVFRVDPYNSRQIAQIYEMQHIKSFDPEEHHERFIEGWRAYFSGLFRTI